MEPSLRTLRFVFYILPYRFKFARRVCTKLIAAGINETAMIPRMTRVKCAFTNGCSPKNFPASTQIGTHKAAPSTQKARKRRYAMRPIPATNGAQVRMIGVKRAMMIVLPPCRS